MAEPKYSRKVGGGRRYIWPPSGPPYELDVPSATTVIGGGLPKPALVGWAARTVAEYAVRNQGWLELDDAAAIDFLKGAANRQRDRKADLGTAVHEAIETYLTGEEGPMLPEAIPYYNGALRFLDDHVKNVIASERTVYSRRYGYAGTADLFANVMGFPHVTICDFKTGKDVWDDAFVQIAAYAKADFYADGEDEVPMPKVGAGIVVLLRDDGTYKAVPCTDLDERMSVFHAAHLIYDAGRSFRQLEPLSSDGS